MLSELRLALGVYWCGVFFLVGGLWVRSGMEWLGDLSVGTDAVVVECSHEQLDELDCLFEVGAFT